MKNFYQLLFLSLFFINISNAQQVIDTINVSTGWNIIGALTSGEIEGPSSNVTLDLIITEPPGIITSPFFGYTGGYYQADSLKRGNGYWVKVSQDGKIIYVSFTDCGTVDYAGKTYNTVLIGDQCWLKENLDIGTMIPGTQDASDNGVIEKYCYDDDPNNCILYGGLYQWDEAMQYITTEGVQGICPSGWHIPTFAEFQALSTTVGGDGNLLKAIGQGNGTNTSGFSALLAGFRHFDTNFYWVGDDALFWSSTEFYTSTANYLYLASSIISLYEFDKINGLCIRCIKD